MKWWAVFVGQLSPIEVLTRNESGHGAIYAICVHFSKEMACSTLIRGQNLNQREKLGLGKVQAYMFICMHII